jgi:hypothetical protein
MKSYFLTIFITSIVFASNIFPHPNQLELKKNGEYESFKSAVIKKRGQMINRPSKEIANYLYKLLNEDVYNYWKDTPWEFYGTTRSPKIGAIACGYFVTNTLTDLGFKINRVQLAEVRSGDMIKVLCTNIHSFTNFKKFQAYLNTRPRNSAFIVGLDSHTGYILKDSKGVYFFHSNYIDKKGVVKEQIEVSQVLKNNKFFMIGSLTDNERLLKKWIIE